MDNATRRRVARAIDLLASDPHPRGYRKLVGGEGDYRIRVGDYRVAYEVRSAEQQVIIHYIRHRREAYR